METENKTEQIVETTDTTSATEQTEQGTEQETTDPLETNLTVPVNYIFNLKTEVEYLRYEREIARPIRLPKEITVGEYNFLADYLKSQYERLTSPIPQPSEKITDIPSEPKV